MGLPQRVLMRVVGHWPSLLQRSQRQAQRFLLWLFVGLWSSLMAAPALSFDRLALPTQASPFSQQASPQQRYLASNDAFQLSQEQYAVGNYGLTIYYLKQAIQSFRDRGDRLSEAVALSNLCLTQQQMGQWSEAQTAMERSLDLLQQTQADAKTWASIWDIQARLQLETGSAEQAVSTLQRAEAHYREIGAEQKLLRNRLNQAQALRMLGFYRRALDKLEPLLALELPDSTEAAQGQRQLGNALRLMGQLEAAQQPLEKSLAIAQRIKDGNAIKAAHLSLGHLDQALGRLDEANWHYQQDSLLATDSLTRWTSTISQMALLFEQEPQDVAKAEIQWDGMPESLAALSPSRGAILLQLNAAQVLLDAIAAGKTNPPSKPLTSLLQLAADSAKAMDDRRLEASALGSLGRQAELTEEFDNALQWTRQALELIREINAPDISYGLHWQLGRLLNVQRKQGKDASTTKEEAIAAYDTAIEDLAFLRRDLVAINRDLRFSFRENVEPLYRESVALLLEAEDNEAALSKARSRIEALQLAELDNFFREACLNGQAILLDQVVDQESPNTAVVYPIILKDRLEVIVKIPGQPLQHQAVDQSSEQVEAVLAHLRRSLPDITQGNAIRSQAQTIHQWLIAPFEAAMQQAEIDTLVFVLDGAFRNLPMAVLYDGQQYLIEKYALGINLGLQLDRPKTIAQGQLNILAAGLSNPPAEFQRFPPLPAIEQEFESISLAGLANQQLLNQDFTRDRLSDEISQEQFNVVHLATHGQFSSRAEDTFILAADGPINVAELDRLLRDRLPNDDQAIELLILSACQTAEGDDRAALGLAGVAIKAGARSTLASLWQVDDRSTALIMGQFYQQLSQPGQTKAKALRQAQLALLGDEDLRDPAFWAPYVLVGNWL